MGTFVNGDVVVLPFPFSDLSGSKKRPALIIAALAGDDVVLCQITSEARTDEYSVVLIDPDFKAGRLQVESRIRPNRIFTADKSIISYKIGSLKETKMKDVEQKLKLIFGL
ncbi:type II toxin-antitoxin system PemK/MazF family toxin [Candidatus Woesearchaeota archaeon]|nr:type II toxin-antitoxin system PemK/MazF family toxin [Candidatus Woesearchaeota archaeon]